jgi:hypothetical protein
MNIDALMTAIREMAATITPIAVFMDVRIA